jgi:hypothetical protein
MGQNYYFFFALHPKISTPLKCKVANGVGWIEQSRFYISNKAQRKFFPCAPTENG